MPLSVTITSLPLPFAQALTAIAEMGFQCVDIVAQAERDDADRHALADSGLFVPCAAIGRDLPAGTALDDAEVTVRRRAVAVVERQIADAAQLGRRTVYLVPGKEVARLPYFADSCAALAEFAQGRMVQLCVEHFPGSALPTAAGTLDWLQSAGLGDVRLLVDIGHCLISREDPAGVLRQGGERIGYLHLDDNDGAGDLHWPLLTGALTEDVLRAALAEARCGVALELNARLADAEQNLRASKRCAERFLR